MLVILRNPCAGRAPTTNEKPAASRRLPLSRVRERGPGGEGIFLRELAERSEGSQRVPRDPSHCLAALRKTREALRMTGQCDLLRQEPVKEAAPGRRVFEHRGVADARDDLQAGVRDQASHLGADGRRPSRVALPLDDQRRNADAGQVRTQIRPGRGAPSVDAAPAGALERRLDVRLQIRR